jgi:hypothetical protein
MKTFSQFLLEATDPKGPIKKYMSPEEIAKKHKISLNVLEPELKLGIKVEQEHTGDKKMARMIALQHLEELPDYYTRLKKAEKVNEETKSGDSSLRDWFTKSRASDGTPGWVQLGGKYAGKPCAKQPGQTTKPKCGSSKMKAALSDDEEESAFRRKNRQDPNPDREGKAKMVATENALMQDMPKPQSAYEKLANDLASDLKRQAAVRDAKNTRIKQQASQSKMTEEKDACYKKVKSRYRVWPSAYASGALVKCRKVGAKNWGTKSESTNSLAYDWDGPIYQGEKRYCPKCQKMESIKECSYGPKFWLLHSSAIEPSNNISIVYSKNEEVNYDFSNWREDFKATEYEFIDLIKPEPIKSNTVKENYTRIQSRGKTYSIILTWRGKHLGVQMFFPQFTKPSKEQVSYEIRKIYPDANVLAFRPSIKDPTKPLLFTGDLNEPK